MYFSIEKNIPLSLLTYFGIGGMADEVIHVAHVTALPEVWAETIALHLPPFILGTGSNLIFSDAGFRGRIFIIDAEKEIWKNNIVTVDAGKNLQKFILDTAEKGFDDLTNLSGIPGTIGGAIFGNSGAFGSEISNTLHSVEFCDENGTIQLVAKDQCEFDYRNSIFKKNPQWCILRATFQLTQEIESKRAIHNVNKLLQERWKKYPKGKGGGSFFKNPKDVPEGIMPYAGWLMEKAGAKGDHIGGAEISPQHANFIMNTGQATQKDILHLAKKWRKIVLDTYGVSLEPEIILVDEYGKKIEL